VGKPSWCDPSTGNVPGRDAASAGGWRRKGRKAGCVNPGDLLAAETEFMPEEGRRTGRTGVRASIRARKGL